MALEPLTDEQLTLVKDRTATQFVGDPDDVAERECGVPVKRPEGFCGRPSSLGPGDDPHLIDDAKSSGEVKITKDLDKSLLGKDVIVVEDIIDTGLTLNYLITNFLSRDVSSMSIAALLDKPERHEIEIEAKKYLGFTIPNHFVVGYGLDFAERYRNLPYIAVPKDPDAFVKQ